MHLFLLFSGIIFTYKVSGKINETKKTMHKRVERKTHLSLKQAFPGLKGADILAHTYPIEPFLVFTEFRMQQAVFGPHPHAGISVMTYILPDSPQGFINRDSQGDFSFIEPGGLHIMQAGRGMQHDEFPKELGIEAHGFQIWINHADIHRFVEPTSMHSKAADVLEIKTDTYTIRLIHGHYGGLKTPYEMVTAVNLLHIYLSPHAALELDAMPMAFLYGLKGNGASEHEEITGQTLLNYSLDGEKIEIVAGANGLEFMFASGTPHNEPITYGGPFVMTTPEQMRQTQERYKRGEMGILAPYSDQ
jgi:quercetin 2,3-dioxygenase